MAPKIQQHLNALTLQMQASGVATAQGLATGLGVDRSTVTRGIGALADRVVRFGEIRGVRYALRRSVRNLGDRWPLYRLDENGRAHELGLLHGLHGGFWLETTIRPSWFEYGCQDGVFPGLPFFLSDACPQGFIGRPLVRDISATLGVPNDPRNWQDDDALAYLHADGSDVPGDIILGDAMLRRAMAAQSARFELSILQENRAEQYVSRAILAMQGGVAGSSAGGEQPKFTSSVRHSSGVVRSVIVKFSPPTGTPAGARWSDLLAAEHHALSVLSERGEESAASELIDAGGRRFLEVTRFDRTPTGRSGVVSLQAIESGLISGSAEGWPSLSTAMEAQGLLSTADAASLRRRWCFGQLIGNTDMHLGNAAVRFGFETPFRLAPTYDMLPMLFAPTTHGEVVPRSFAVVPPLPRLRTEWNAVLPWATEFWSRVVSDNRVSTEFRSLAELAGENVVRSASLG